MLASKDHPVTSFVNMNGIEMNNANKNIACIKSTLVLACNFFVVPNLFAVDDMVQQTVPEACIVSLDSGEKYCLPIGKRSGYSLPEYIYGHRVYVNAPEGTAVMLSDWDNLSYNRIATFIGTVEHNQLKNVKAYNGQTLDFSRPHSMRVLASNEPLGCIVSLETKEEYCLPVGKRSGYALPDYIVNHPVSVKASKGTAVMLSDWANLSYNRIAIFKGIIEHDQLKDVKAYNGQHLDFSHPRSMRVIRLKHSKKCVVSLETAEEYCFPNASEPDQEIPNFIFNHPIDIKQR